VSVLRFAAVVALSIWVGGLIVLGAIAAPALFAALTGHDPIAGRATAGVVFAAIFHRFQQLSWGLAAIVLASLGTRAALGPRPRRLAVRVWTVLMMVAVSLGTVLIVSPRIESLRRTLPANLTQVASDDPQKVAFGRWHAVSTALMAVTAIAGLGLMWSETHD
jgi:Domain of unknown function (DUF4149)